MGNDYLFTRERIGDTDALYLKLVVGRVVGTYNRTEQMYKSPLSLYIDHCDGNIVGVEVICDLPTPLNQSHSQWMFDALSRWLTSERALAVRDAILAHLRSNDVHQEE